MRPDMVWWYENAYGEFHKDSASAKYVMNLRGFHHLGEKQVLYSLVISSPGVVKQGERPSIILERVTHE